MNLLTILFFSLSLAHKIPEFSLEPPLLESGINNVHWNFGGDAFFKVDKYIRLTSNIQSQFGWLWSRSQMSLDTAKNWSMVVEFQVGNHAGLAGDGFAFWLTRDKEIEGKAFGSAEKFVGLGCFFDTYQNMRHSDSWPYISCMLNDGKSEFDHHSDGYELKIGGCSVDFRFRDLPTSFKVVYNQNIFTLYTQIDKTDGWDECFSKAVKLPEKYYVGFSAATGGVSDNHDIFRITTLSLDSGKSQVGGAPPRYGESSHFDSGREDSKSSGFFTFLMNLLLLVVALFIVYVIWVYYQSTKAQSYKRF